VTRRDLVLPATNPPKKAILALTGHEESEYARNVLTMVLHHTDHLLTGCNPEY
jgi:hypothetical protein